MSTAAPATLREEHALLMRGLRTRADLVLREADAGRWPAVRLGDLLDYFHREVLRQVTDTEWLLFRTVGQGNGLVRLRHDHLELRLGIDVLAQIAAIDSTETSELAVAVRDLIARLDAHLAAEQRLLDAGSDRATGQLAGRTRWLS